MNRIARRELLGLMPGLLWSATVAAAEAGEPVPVLSIEGLARRPAADTMHFTLQALMRLPQHRIKTHTPWHTGEPAFSGPLLRDVLAAAGVDCKLLRLRALNDYHVDMPLDDVRTYDVVLAHQIDGQAIAVRDKGPLFVMYPFDRHPDLRNSVYFSRCIWQLRRIECR